ncbi:MAG: hypothetical protein IIV27_10210, partial [Clostridia bacterium]|nr:hypothetical protein [Clostridia bacterium]
TSDRKPSDMLTLEDRLRTRFEWGLLADIQPPDYETRMAILKNKAKTLALDLDDDVCNYIAINITNNVRQRLPSSSSTRSTPWPGNVPRTSIPATRSARRPSTNCWSRWTASRPRRTSSSSVPRTARTSWTPPS